MRDYPLHHRHDYRRRSADQRGEKGFPRVNNTNVAAVADVVEREWKRYSAGERLARFAVYAAIVAAVVLSIRTVEVIPDFILDAPEQIADLLKRMWPPDFASYPQEIHAALLDSLHIATVGTVLGVAMALPFGFLAARNVTPWPWLNWAARFVLIS